MATLSAAELTNLRTKWHYIIPKMSVLQPATLLSARVNNASIARGDRSIAYDTGSGTFASIEAGQTLWVGTSAGDNDVGKIRIKSITGSAASGTITVDENGIDWIDDLYLTIKHNYEIWAIPPRIASDGTFYKFYNVAYSDQNENVNPVAIAGPHRAGELASGSIVFNIDASSSYAVASGATISSYLWSCTGGTIAANTSATTTITFTAAGTYWLKLTVTDSNGKTQTTYRVIFVHDTDNPPYRNFSIQNLTGDWNSNGWSFSVAAHGDVELSDFPDGSLVVLWYDGYMDGVETYVNVWDQANEVLCNGYIRRDDDNDDLDSGDGTVTFAVDTPHAVLDNRNEMGTVSIEAATNPSVWYEYSSWLTVGRAVHHLLKWQSTVLETCDVYGLLDNTLGLERAQMTENSLLQRINSLAFNRGIFAKMVSDRLGRLHLVEDIQYFNESNRNAEDTVFSLDEDDISGDVSLSRESDKQQALGFIDGFEFDGSTATPYIAVIPGYIDSGTSIQLPAVSGTGSRNQQRQVVASQTDANEKVGRDLAAANNPYKALDTPLRGNYIGAFDIVPSLGWYGWGLADATLKRNLPLNGTKAICRRVQASFPPAGDVYSGDIQVTVGLEQEAFGPDGIPGNYPTSYPTITPPSPNWTLPSVEVIGGFIALYTNFTTGDLEAIYLDESGGTISAGSAATISATGTGSRHAIVGISTTKAVAIYNDSGWKAKVLSVSGTTITAGSEVSVATGSDACSIAKISSSQVLVVYEEGGDGRSMVLSISGTTITTNSPTIFFGTNSTDFVSLAMISSTKAIVCWRNDATFDGQAIILNISGTTITAGASSYTFESSNTVTDLDVVVLSSSQAAVVYEYGTSGNGDILARVLDISGDVITPGSSATMISASISIFGGQGHKFVADLTSTTFLTTPVILDSPYYVTSIVGSVSGSTITPGSTVDIITGLPTSDVWPAVEEYESGDKAMVLYIDSNTGTIYAVTLSISGSTITDNGNDTSLSVLSTDPVALCKLI